MANNLRYLLEHFCLDGQKIDISSQLDEENANNIEKINTQTVPSINARIDDIKNTDIPNINSRIDSIKNTDIPSINQKINTINNTTIPSIQENVNAVNEKADRINESVAKNTRDIGTLSDNVTMQGNTINSINTEKIPSVENKVETVARETLRISKAHKHDINDIGASLSTLHDETSSNTSNIGNLTTNVNELTTKVNANTDSINELTTKVNTNTDSINTINNTSIPHLQSEIDNLSGGGTGSVGELREKVETNTTNISTLNGKVDTNTTAINTINDTSIPNLQNEIDSVKSTLSFEWTPLLRDYRTTKGFIVNMYANKKLHLIQINVSCEHFPAAKEGESIIETINDFQEYTPHQTASSSIHVNTTSVIPGLSGNFFVLREYQLTLGFTLSSYDFSATISGSLLYFY